MDWQRSLLIGAIVLVFGVLFIRWNDFQQTRQPPPAGGEEAMVVPSLSAGDVQSSGDSAIPLVTQPSSTAEPGPQKNAARLITVRTDVLDVVIDTLGGDIVRVALPEHRVTVAENAEPIVMLNRTATRTYIAQSGLIGQNGTDTGDARPLFSAAQDNYTLAEGTDTLTVALRLQQGDVEIEKQFIFRRGDYLLNVDYRIKNRGETPWQAHLFGQIQRDSSNPNASSGAMAPSPFLGAALTSAEHNYIKNDFDDIAEGPIKTTKLGGWVAMVQHYFISAWVPDQQLNNEFLLRKLGNRDLYTMGFTSPAQTVQPGEEGRLGAAFYVGPKDQATLEKISPYLDLTVDYGWLWWVAKPLFYGLTFFYSVVANWGWSIVLLTILIKGIFYPLSAASYRSMARMRKLQPEMKRLKDLYGDDRQKMSQETMNLYKREKVNPLGGCLPMLIQMPVFIALYWVLNESVELRHAPWIYWIVDLSVKDPFYVLPILNGVSMYFLQTLQPAPPDPTQAKVMKIMPVAFSFFFMFFPAGLVLYWTVNSVLSIAQQWAITRKIEAAN